MVCRELHVLPNDPALQDLTPLQLSWIVANVVNDADQVRRQSASGGSRSDGEHSTIMETELSDEEFAGFSDASRHRANLEAATRRL